MYVSYDSQVILSLLVQGPHFAESRGLPERLVWKPHSFVCAREGRRSEQDKHQKKIPQRDEDFFSSCKEWCLHFTVGFGSSSYWSSGRKQRNHNSGLKGGNLGCDCLSAPSVPLFTASEGLQLEGLRHTSSFVVPVFVPNSQGGWHFPQIFLQFWPCVCWTSGEFLCLSPRWSVHHQWPQMWECSHMQRMARVLECQAKLDGTGTDDILMKFFPFLQF